MLKSRKNYVKLIIEKNRDNLKVATGFNLMKLFNLLKNWNFNIAVYNSIRINRIKKDLRKNFNKKRKW